MLNMLAMIVHPIKSAIEATPIFIYSCNNPVLDVYYDNNIMKVKHKCSKDFLGAHIYVYASGKIKRNDLYYSIRRNVVLQALDKSELKDINNSEDYKKIYATSDTFFDHIDGLTFLTNVEIDDFISNFNQGIKANITVVPMLTHSQARYMFVLFLIILAVISYIISFVTSYLLIRYT